MRHAVWLFAFVFLLSGVVLTAYALDPEHRVAGSYGGTRLYAGDSVVISPQADAIRYNQETREESRHSSNAANVDPLCRSVSNARTSGRDYFIPWRSALVNPNDPGETRYNEWLNFIKLAESGRLPGVSVGPCCFPRVNEIQWCNVEPPFGARKAGALPASHLVARTPVTIPGLGQARFTNRSGTDPNAPATEVGSYAALGDVFVAQEGYNRKQIWQCRVTGTNSAEWQNIEDLGGCERDGKCNVYDPVENPTGYHGRPTNSIPGDNNTRSNVMCNGVIPVAVNDSQFPNPDSVPYPNFIPGEPIKPPYGTAGWTWKCPGQTGGTSEVCHAPYDGVNPLNGMCGPPHGSGNQLDQPSAVDPTASSTTKSEVGLCRVGTPTDVIETATGWTWTCEGVEKGSTANCWANKPKPADPPRPGCGDRARTNLVEFEVVNGWPDTRYLCNGYSTVVPDSMSGSGLAGDPWRWKCVCPTCGPDATPATTDWCQAAYGGKGACGVSHGATSPFAPNVNLCASGRCFSNISGSQGCNGPPYKNEHFANPKKDGYTWACLGHDQTTGKAVNGLCSAARCLQCDGKETKSVTMAVAGNYGGCAFTAEQATVTFPAVTYLYQSSNEPVDVDVRFGEGSGSGKIGAEGTQPRLEPETGLLLELCQPCYKRVIEFSGQASISFKEAVCGIDKNTPYLVTPTLRR
ncbi:MAG: hypothetical protein FWF24_04015 [Alphaproteobacteria bacterium]|nr:hypothetical protein [Alphaproteobacteria bacterium]